MVLTAFHSESVHKIFRLNTNNLYCHTIIIIVGSTALGGPWPPLQVS